MNLETKNAILQCYPFKIEMHTHSSPASSCSDVKPEVVVKYYKERGYDAIVMTNHFLRNGDKPTVMNRQLADYRAACQVGEQLGLKVLLGTEARFDENPNDYLIYGVDEDILDQIFDYFELGVEAFRKNVPLNNSVFVQAHPYRKPSVPIDPALLDGVEVFNLHPNHNSAIALAALYAKESPSLLITAGSDFHHDVRGHCGICALRTSVLPNDSFELAEILKSRDYVLQIYDTILLP